MKALKEKGFTLVELMVVIAIIGMLAAALTTLVPRVREMGSAARCKANLRNLAIAAQNWSLKEHDGSRHYPAAGSWESSWFNAKIQRQIYKSGDNDNWPDAWVSWTYGTTGTWPWRDIDNTTSWKDNMLVSRFDGERGYVSVTNGCLWEYVGKDISVYVCASHKKVATENPEVKKLVRSYVMNGYFGWDSADTKGKKAIDEVTLSGTASLRLMFAELPGLERKEDKKGVDISDRAIDGVLQYDQGESIGFNHRAARKLVGHVAFVDGHVDTIIRPSPSDEDLKKLTKALCEATEIEREIRLKMR